MKSLRDLRIFTVTAIRFIYTHGDSNNNMRCNKIKTIIIIILIYKYGDGRIFVRVVYAGAMHSTGSTAQCVCR